MDRSILNDLADVQLQAQVEPIVAIDPTWCFGEQTTLRVKQNPWTLLIKIKNNTTKKTLFRIKSTTDAVCDLFDIVEEKNPKTQTLTIHRFGFTGAAYDVHTGAYRTTTKRAAGYFTVDVSKEKSAITFRDAQSGATCHAVVEGSFADRIAIVSIKRDDAPWQAVARITRPEYKPFQMEYYTLEIAAGVDAQLIVALWLARWQEVNRSLVSPFGAGRGAGLSGLVGVKSVDN